MERLTISKSEKQTIFEIYRACRLCGAGGGYRMPIIQNIVDLDGPDVELSQKIQECLQLEVRPDDRMPPLICELCVEKLNDFYGFMQMAKKTNIRTRKRLGLPLQTERKLKEETNNKDCIPGVTEPLEEPVPKKCKAGPKCSKIKKEAEPVKVKEDVSVPSQKESRSSSVSSRSSGGGRLVQPPLATYSRVQHRASPKLVQPVNQPTPQPSRSQPTKSAPKGTQLTVENKGGKEKISKQQENPENEVKTHAKRISRKELADLLQDNVTHESNSLLVPRAHKRLRESDIPKPLMVPKRPRPTPKEPTKATPKETKEPKETAKEPAREPTPPRLKPRPKSKQDPKNVPVPLRVLKPKVKAVETPPPAPKAEPPKTFTCTVCKMQLKTVQALSNHTKSHVPNYTKPQNACNPCGKWFLSAEEAGAHHRYHRAATFPYHCRRCFDDYRTLPEYDLHIANHQCVPWETVADVKCDDCWKSFPTRNLLTAHKCLGVDARPGGKCQNCSRTYATFKNLKKHESTCTQKRKRDLIADPEVLRRLKPMQVRISRCDDLLDHAAGDYCDVSDVEPNYGLDKQYVYPYMKVCTNFKVKTASSCDTKDKNRQSEQHSYIHWDSDDSDGDTVKQVDSLATLSIKKLFSKNLLGKVPRKRRKIKIESATGEMSDDISEIINSFGDELGKKLVCKPSELLLASLNEIIGVPNGEGLKYGVESDIMKFVTSEQNKPSNVSDSVKDADNYSLTKDMGNEIVARYENEESETVLNERDHTNICDTKKDVDDSGSLSADTENEIEAREENDDVIINKSKTVSSEISKVANLSSTRNVVDDVGSLTRDMKDEHIIRKENDVCMNESTAFSDKNEIANEIGSHNDSLPNDVLTGNETLLNENDNLNTNYSNDNDTENTLLKSDVSSRKYAENDNERVNVTNSLSDNSTNMHLIETENVNNEQSNDENVCDGKKEVKEQVSSNYLPLDTELYSGNAKGIRTDNENLNSFDNIKKSIKEVSHQHSVDLETQLSDLVGEVYSMNGINDKNIDQNKINDDCNESDNEKNEVNSVNKESPIKHSIENIIGDSDKNPEKYIDEVISSLENIIMKNPRNEETEQLNGETTKSGVDDIDDQNLMDALDAQIGDEDRNTSDNEKITLDDLLPKEDRKMQLDDISDEDFNFDD